MDRVLIIDKPAGLTSHDVVARVRRVFKTRRVGHTGTLDPFATGVMIVLVGQATRLAQFLDKDEKEYETVVRFGFETDTGDLTGTPMAETKANAGEIRAQLEATNWQKVLAEFSGALEQVPPMYSAKKIAGRKLYELARQGIEVERHAAAITISKLEFVEMLSSTEPDVRLRVACSAGTYIRTLAEDIGRRIGLPAHLRELRRTRAGRFKLSDGVTLDELERSADPRSLARPPAEAVEHLPSVRLAADRVEKTRNGLSSRTEDSFAAGQPLRMLTESDQLIAVGLYDEAERSVRPKIVLI